MSWFTGIIVYILIWWIVLFAVLPFGTRPVAQPDDKSGWRGAPEHPHLWRTIMYTTLVASVLWVGADLLISSDLISFRHGWFAAPQ